MNKVMTRFGALLPTLALLACNKTAHVGQAQAGDSVMLVNTVARPTQVIQPAVITDSVRFDTDDPAIWINPADPGQSLVIGTDKDERGGLDVFDLQGKKIVAKSIPGLKRPDNVDLEYGLMLQGKPVDIAVTTERMTHNLRIYSLPDMKPLDHGGIPVFEGETGPAFRDLMGIALYKAPATGEIYAIVAERAGPKTILTCGNTNWKTTAKAV